MATISVVYSAVDEAIDWTGLNPVLNKAQFALLHCYQLAYKVQTLLRPQDCSVLIITQ